MTKLYVLLIAVVFFWIEKDIEKSTVMLEVNRVNPIITHSCDMLHKSEANTSCMSSEKRLSCG